MGAGIMIRYFKSGLMLRGLKIFPFLVLVCAGLAFAQQDKVYRNNVLGYQLKYPAGFKIKTMGSATVFSSYVEDRKFAFSPSVNVVVVDLGADHVDMDSFYKQSKDSLERSFGNVKFLEDKKETLSGSSANRLVYVSRQKKADFKFLQLMCIHNNKAYVVTYTALQDQYDKHLKTAQAIIKSFKFTAN